MVYRPHSLDAMERNKSTPVIHETGTYQGATFGVDVIWDGQANIRFKDAGFEAKVSLDRFDRDDDGNLVLN